MALLEISGIDVFYGRVQAVRGASLTVDKGEVVALIGSNRAGQTTTLRTISGPPPPGAGPITVDDQDLPPTEPHKTRPLPPPPPPKPPRLIPRLTRPTT